MTMVMCLIDVKGFHTDGAIAFTNFPTNWIFASSTASEDRNEPSPNLFNCAKGGNSNST